MKLVYFMYENGFKNFKIAIVVLHVVKVDKHVANAIEGAGYLVCTTLNLIVDAL